MVDCHCLLSGSSQTHYKFGRTTAELERDARKIICSNAHDTLVHTYTLWKKILVAKNFGEWTLLQIRQKKKNFGEWTELAGKKKLKFLATQFFF